MKQSRSLSLKREALADLSTDDLRGVAGAAAAMSGRYGNCTLDNSYLACSLNCPLTWGSTC